MTAPRTILLVEDDAAVALVIRETLAGECDQIVVVPTLAERDRWLARGERPALLITDVMLPDGDGLESLMDAAIDSAVPVIVLSAQNTLDTAVRAADIGSFDYLPKPFDLAELTASVRAALRRDAGSAAHPAIAATDAPDHGLIGRAPAMQAVYRTIARLASNDLAVLILGESGTGKDVVAQAIHATGLRRDGPFVALNMAAIPRELIEAELFGHEKGAFTGAYARSAGRFEQAAGGTLFLDEIGDMPLEAQTRLLRVLQSGEYSTVGGSQLLRADVRIIAATHRDMEALVAEGRFRQDLYYRLNVIPVTLPPLRERRSDIRALAEFFMAQGRAIGLPDRQFTAEALGLLERHDWPGNVRELANVIQRLSVLARDTRITAQDVLGTLGTLAEVHGDDGSVRAGGVADAVQSWFADQVALDPAASDLHMRLLDLVDAALLRALLAHTGGNQLEAARRLGINRNTVRKRLTELGIPTSRSG